MKFPGFTQEEKDAITSEVVIANNGVQADICNIKQLEEGL